MSLKQNEYEIAVKHIAELLRTALHEHASRVQTSTAALQRAVIGELLGEETLADGRARYWRVRVRLYDVGKLGRDPEADTDAFLPADQHGQMVIRGLQQVISWAAEYACLHHGRACAGLEDRTLQRKLRSLRSMMAARKDGTGVLHANYEVAVGDGVVRYMSLRADVQKVDRPIDPSVDLMVDPPKDSGAPGAQPNGRRMPNVARLGRTSSPSSSP